MYAVVRADLPTGAKACQAAHALRQFQTEYPELEAQWWADSNTLVILEATDLEELQRSAIELELPCIRFVEPDWHPDGTLTALALGPAAEALLSSLPLMR